MKVLIEVNSNIGDLVMNVPILNFLKSKYENIEIDLIADKRSIGLLSETSFIKNIFIKEKNNKAKTLLFMKLLKNRYDLAIGLRSDAVPLLIRAKKKLYKTDRDKNLFGKVSETEYHFSILNSLFDIDYQKIDSHIEFKKETLTYIKELISFKENEKILFVGPGANFDFKVWPKDNFIKLINLIKDKFDKVILVGAPNETELCDFISKETNTIDLSGKTNLVQVSALLSLGTLFIGNDSGLGHISAAQGVDTFSVFAHADPIRYTPFKQHSISREDHDITKITVEQVYEKLKKESLI